MACYNGMGYIKKNVSLGLQYYFGTFIPIITSPFIVLRIQTSQRMQHKNLSYQTNEELASAGMLTF